MALKRAISCLVLLVAVGSGVVLFYSEDAAKPGDLTAAHERFGSCGICHTPWSGVEASSCQRCHYFDNVQRLRPAIRFHEANSRCLECHTEHKGKKASIAAMDHTILHPDLTCSTCHFDPHSGLFGESCRECHGIETWSIQGFDHPEQDTRQCRRCHRPPRSHRSSWFAKHVLQAHEQVFPREKEIGVEECWRCHVTQGWGHLLMEHGQ